MGVWALAPVPGSGPSLSLSSWTAPSSHCASVGRWSCFCKIGVIVLMPVSWVAMG